METIFDFVCFFACNCEGGEREDSFFKDSNTLAPVAAVNLGIDVDEDVEKVSLAICISLFLASPRVRRLFFHAPKVYAKEKLEDVKEHIFHLLSDEFCITL